MAVETSAEIEARYKKLWNMAYRRCMEILRNEEDAKDAASDVIVYFLRKEAEGLHINDLRAWIRAMAERRSFDRSRKRKLDACRFYAIATNVSLRRIREQNLGAGELGALLNGNGPPGGGSAGKDAFPAADGGYTQVEAEMLARAVLEEEDEKVRDICFYRYHDGMTLQEIGMAVGLGKSRVGKILEDFKKRARLKLGRGRI